MRTIYYAHPMCTYRSADEEVAIKRIERRFRKCPIVNPREYDGHPEKRSDTVGFCLKLIDKCDVVVFHRIVGKITAGVGREVNHALRGGKKVFELIDKVFVEITEPVRHVSIRQTYTAYDRWRADYWQRMSRGE